MHRIALALACLLPLTPACSVYSQETVRERYVETEAFAPRSLPERTTSAGVTVVRRDGVSVTYPAGTAVHGGADGVEIAPAGAVHAHFDSAEVDRVEVMQAKERSVKKRVRSSSGSTALTAVVVGLAIVGTVAIAVAADSMHDSLSGIGNGIGSLGGLGLPH